MVSAVESRAQKEIDEKNVEMAEKVSQARLEQIKVHFKQDMETLKQRMPTAESAAAETAKDQLFLRERQRTVVTMAKSSFPVTVQLPHQKSSCRSRL